MEKGLVSIVVPIYRVEQYLDRCIESVVNQTYRNLEIILVDDGSPDNCPQKCDEWAARDSRIKVIHKENEGLGMARNTGIDHATGEYICFFDSDDYVALNAIEKAYQCILDYHAEIILFGYYSVDLRGRIKKCDIPQTTKVLYQGDEVQKYILPNLIGPDPRTGENANLNMYAWACMYSMQTIRRTNWRFVSEREYIFEDSYSHLLLYKDIASVAVLSEALYFYCENRMSLTHAYQKGRYIRIKDWYDACIKVCGTFEYDEQIMERMLDGFVRVTIAAMRNAACANCDKREKKAEIDAILKDRKLYEAISNINIKPPNKRWAVVFIAIKCRFYGLANLMVMATGQKYKLMKIFEKPQKVQ